MDVTFHPHPVLPLTVVCDACGVCVADIDEDRSAHREWHAIVGAHLRGL